MERLTSRKSAVIRAFRDLARSSAAREEKGLFLCDGQKLLQEALRSGVSVETVLWKENRAADLPPFPQEALLPADLFDYVSPMSNSPGPLFSVRMPSAPDLYKVRRVLALEELQDPGNVGTVLRTADAFGVDLVVLLEGCADLYAPKTVRASMGAVFRQAAVRMDAEAFISFCREKNLPLWGAALTDTARDLRSLPLDPAAVLIGSEGHGLSRELLRACDGEIIIPMSGEAESLNAAVAAAIVMWEMQRSRQKE
ncbi:MAG: RNA methyltransferase [Oscillospiraceae bacterium]|nr:RNA methyltransferase [Oscillospiraceae bacterium]